VQNSFMTTFNPIPERVDCRRLRPLLTACHHHRRRRQPQKAFANAKRPIDEEEE
jgi:hypothetical protein